MTDSMNFGPEWLRNLSSDGSTSGGGGGSKPQLADFRYGREEMLTLYTKGLRAPPSLVNFPVLYSTQYNAPLALIPTTEEERSCGVRLPQSGGMMSRGQGRGYSLDRGGLGGRTQRGRGSYQSYGRPMGYDSGNGIGGGGGGGWGSTVGGALGVGGGGGNNVGDHPPTSEWSPRKEFVNYRSASAGGTGGGSSAAENWRRNSGRQDDDDGWRAMGGGGPGGVGATRPMGPEKWTRSTSWRDGDAGGPTLEENHRSGSGPRIAGEPGGAGWHERQLAASMAHNNHHGGGGGSYAMPPMRGPLHKRIWDEDHLPEWASEQLSEVGTGGGTFDATGAFHGSDDEHEKGQANNLTYRRDLQKSTSQQQISNKSHSPPMLSTSKSAVSLSRTPKTPTGARGASDDPATAHTQLQSSHQSPQLEQQVPVKQRDRNSPAKQSVRTSRGDINMSTDSNHMDESSLLTEASSPDRDADRYVLQSGEPNRSEPSPQSISNGIGTNKNESLDSSRDEEDFDRLQEDLVLKLVKDEEPAACTPHIPPPNLGPPLSDQWFYQDPQGDLQGPFNGRDMSAWCKAGYFTQSLLIRRGCDKRFFTLGDLVQAFGDTNPFQLTTAQQMAPVHSEALPALPGHLGGGGPAGGVRPAVVVAPTGIMPYQIMQSEAAYRQHSLALASAGLTLPGQSAVSDPLGGPHQVSPALVAATARDYGATNIAIAEPWTSLSTLQQRNLITQHLQQQSQPSRQLPPEVQFIQPANNQLLHMINQMQQVNKVPNVPVNDKIAGPSGPVITPGLAPNNAMMNHHHHHATQAPLSSIEALLQQFCNTPAAASNTANAPSTVTSSATSPHLSAESNAAKQLPGAVRRADPGESTTSNPIHDLLRQLNQDQAQQVQHQPHKFPVENRVDQLEHQWQKQQRQLYNQQQQRSTPQQLVHSAPPALVPNAIPTQSQQPQHPNFVHDASLSSMRLQQQPQHHLRHLQQQQQHIQQKPDMDQLNSLGGMWETVVPRHQQQHSQQMQHQPSVIMNQVLTHPSSKQANVVPEPSNVPAVVSEFNTSVVTPPVLREERKKKSNDEKSSGKDRSDRKKRNSQQLQQQQQQQLDNNGCDRKKEASEEKQRRKEEERIRRELDKAKREIDEKRHRDHTEKKRQKELRRVAEEEHRRKLEEQKRQDDIERERQAARDRDDAAKEAAVSVANKSMKSSPAAPWLNPTANIAPVACSLVAEPTPLTEIQRLEREMRAERTAQLQQQQQHQMLQQQLRAQQLAQEMADKPGSFTWANKAMRPSKVKSLAEIQAEEHELLMKKQAEDAKIAQQKEKEAAAVPTAGIWSGQSLTWSSENALANTGFWDDIPKQQPKQATPVKPTAQHHVTPQSKTPQSNRAQAQQQPQQHQNTPPVAQTKKSSKKDSERNLNKGTDEFVQWCGKMLANMSADVDVPTFVGFLKDIESAYEVREYCRDYLGEGNATNQFAAQFLERRRMYKPPKSAAHKDDMCAPAPAINPSQHGSNGGGASTTVTTNNANNLNMANSHGGYISGGTTGTLTQQYQEFQEVKGKGKKEKKKSKMTKVDSRILGFSVTAAPDRINVGDRDYGDNT